MGQAGLTVGLGDGLNAIGKKATSVHNLRLIWKVNQPAAQPQQPMAAYAQPTPESKSQRSSRVTQSSEQDEDDTPLPTQCGMGPGSGANSVLQDARDGIENLIGGECLGAAKQSSDGSATPI